MVGERAADTDQHTLICKQRTAYGVQLSVVSWEMGISNRQQAENSRQRRADREQQTENSRPGASTHEKLPKNYTE